MRDLYALMYISLAAPGIRAVDVFTLAQKAKAQNARQHVTGVLCHSSDAFVQVVEGPEDSIRHLAECMHLDTRHRNMVVLAEGAIDARRYPSWDLVYRNIDLRICSQIVADTGWHGWPDTPPETTPAPMPAGMIAMLESRLAAITPARMLDTIGLRA